MRGEVGTKERSDVYRAENDCGRRDLHLVCISLTMNYKFLDNNQKEKKLCSTKEEAKKLGPLCSEPTIRLNHSLT